MSQTSRMITATVPPISGSTPGIWDSAAVTPKLDIPVFSGVYIESVGGAGTTTEVDVTLYQGSDVRAELPKMNAKASYGTNVRQGSYASCNRVTLSNSTSKQITVEIRLNVDTYYIYNPPGSGGGGVASHVVVDGVTEVTGNVAVTGVNFPDKMNVDVTNDAPIPVSGTVAVSGVNFPAKMNVDVTNDAPIPVSGDVGLKSGATVAVTGDVGLKSGATVAVTGDVGLKSGATVAVTGDVGLKSGATVAVTGDVGLKSGAAVAISGVPTVKLQSGTIDVNPTPAPSLSTAANVSVNRAVSGLVNARAKRVSLLMQAEITNTAPITIKANDGTNICHLNPGGSMGVEYSGELQAISTADGQGIFVSEFYNP